MSSDTETHPAPRDQEAVEAIIKQHLSRHENTLGCTSLLIIALIIITARVIIPLLRPQLEEIATVAGIGIAMLWVIVPVALDNVLTNRAVNEFETMFPEGSLERQIAVEIFTPISKRFWGGWPSQVARRVLAGFSQPSFASPEAEQAVENAFEHLQPSVALPEDADVEAEHGSGDAAQRKPVWRTSLPKA